MSTQVWRALPLLAALAAACVSGERSFDLETVPVDHGTLAVGTEVRVWARSRSTRTYPLIPGGRDRVATEIVSHRVDPEDLVEVEVEDGGLRLRAVAPGTVRIIVTGEVLGRKSQAETILEIREIARLDWRIATNASVGPDAMLLPGVLYPVSVTPVDVRGEPLYGRGLGEIHASPSIQQLGTGEGPILVFADAPTEGSFTFRDETLAVRFAVPSDVSFTFDRVEDGFAIGTPNVTGETAPPILPRELDGTAEVLTPSVCTLRESPMGEDAPQTPWRRHLRVRPIENVRSGTCKVRATIGSREGAIEAEGSFEVEALFAEAGP